MNREKLESLARTWWHDALLRMVCVLIGTLYFALIPVTLAKTYFWAAFPFVVFGLTLFGCLRRARKLDASGLARHLDRTYPELEESSRLWLRSSESLTLLERLQLERLNRAATHLTSQPTASVRFGQPPPAPQRHALIFVVVAGVALFTVKICADRFGAPDSAPSTAADLSRSPRPAVMPRSARVFPKITSGALTITPPAYTGHPPRETAGLNAEVEEGALVEWRVTLDRPVREAHLIFGIASADRLRLQPGGGQALRATRPITETALYTLAATLPDGTPWTPPEIYSLKVIKDQPPTLRVLQPAAPRTVILPVPPAPSNDSIDAAAPPHAASCFVEVQASDDYGVAGAHLVATVAKGSGEAVKFREQTIPFDGDNEEQSPDGSPVRTRRFTRTLDLAALGLEPGDELYFYVEARDNRQPAPNRTRSETRFLVLQGSDKPASTTGRGVAGINLVPQYFRSERQLIIDTEKLLADRASLPDREFRARANDLGADQALLRLRYGRFLGEDQESDPLTDHAEINLDPLRANAPESKPGPHAAASITERFRQEHAEQDSLGGSDDARDAGLRVAPTTPLSSAEVRQPFVDSHDTHDKATFFDDESKGTMKDALSAMWTAEGALRVAQPQDALAPEHRALDILKDLQQSARAYVQHVGFDAPPLQIDARRLKGDATDVPARLTALDPGVSTDAAQGDVRTALAAPGSKETLRRVEPALAAAATRQPDEFLAGLQALHRMMVEATASEADSRALERALLRLLPPARALPERGVEAAPTLDQPYFHALQTGEATR